jgi:hypothetical protein
MAATITPEQAVSLLRDLLTRASDSIAGDLPIAQEISEAMEATAGYDHQGFDMIQARAGATLERTRSASQELFEAHMLVRDKNVMLEKKDDGNYASWFTERYWMTWLAACESTNTGAGVDTLRLDWLDENIFHREMEPWDKRRAPGHRMFVLFAPDHVQGTARKIIDAARTPVTSAK